MLDELQAIHEDLVKGLKTSMQKCGDMMKTKVSDKSGVVSSPAAAPPPPARGGTSGN